MSDDVLRKLRIGIPGAAAGLIANFAPDPTLPGIAGYWPGVTAAENLTAAGGQLYDATANLINKSIGTNLPMAPDSFRALGERAAATEQQIYEQLGGAPLMTPADQVIRDTTSLAGGFAVPGLGIAKAFKTAGIGAGIGGVGSTAKQLLHPTEGEEGIIPAGAFSDDGAPPARTQEAKNSVIPPGAFSDTWTQPTATDASPIPAGAFSDGGTGQPSAPAYSVAGQSDTTWGESLLDIALAAAGLKAGHMAAQHGARVNEAARILRVEDPKYLVKAKDYEATQIRKASGEISDPNAVEAPIPEGKAMNTIAAKMMDYGLESGAGLQNTLKLTADNPRASQKIKAQTNAFFDEQHREQRFSQFIRTGYEPESGVSMPSPVRWANDFERLDKERYRVLNDGLAAADEIDIRKVKAAEARTPDPVNDRYHFYNQSLEQLEAHKAKMLADPITADLANRAGQIRAAQLEIAKHHGYIPEADAIWQKTNRPNYLPESDIKGEYVGGFNKKQFRSRGGLEQVNTKSTSLWAQQLQKFFHDIDANNFHRDVIDHFENAQAKTPGMVPLVTRLSGRPPNARDGSYVRVRRSSGETWYKIENRGLYEALSGKNVDAQRVHFDSMSKFKQLVQAGTTGAASMATLRVVPLRNLLFTAFQAPINATGGVYGGPVSALTRGKLHKAFTVPLDMPLNVVGGLATWARGGEKRLALFASDVFRPDNQNFMTQTIRSYIGDAPLTNFSNAMFKHYMESDFYRGRAEGMGGQSLQQRIRAPTLTREGKFFKWTDDKVIRLQMARLAPRIVIDMDAGVVGRHARPFLLKLQEGVISEFTHANEATHDFLYSLNKNNPAFHGDSNQLVHAVRNIVGDPSVSGGGRVAQGIRAFVPYSNVIAQGTRAKFRAIAHNPVDTLAAMVTGYGSLVALSMLTAFQSDENLDHFVNSTSAQDRSKFLHIYNGPGAESSLLRIPYPGESTWFTPLITEAMFHLFNMPGAPHSEEVRGDIMGFLKNFLFQHIDTTTAEGVKHGINDSFNFLDIPPVVKVGMTAVGGSGRIDFARIITDYQTGNLGMNSIVNAPRQPQALPNQSSDDAAAHGQNGKRWVEIAGSIFGLSNSIVQHMFNLDSYVAQGNSGWDSMGGVYDDWKQMGKDLNPMVNTLLWDNATLLSKVPPIIEQSRRALHEMEKTRGSRTGERMEGTTGGRNPLEVPVYETDQGKVPEDPIMRQMYETTDSYLRHLGRATLPEINNLEKQLREVSAKMHNPQEKRAWVNEQQRIISDKYRYVYDEVIRLNDDLSKIARTRVDIRKGIDWQGKVDQFMR